MGRNYIFQQDNTGCHTARATRRAFRMNGINPIDWPAKSPDLSPIENMWHLTKNLVYNGAQFQSGDELWGIIKKCSYQVISQNPDLLPKLYAGMGVRQANDDDIERIVDLFLQGFPFKWKYTFREEEMDEVRKLFIHDFRVAETVIPNTLVAEENGKIVGICQMKYPHVKPMKYGNYRADISFKSVFKVILSSGMLEYLYTMKDDECIIDHLVVDSQCRGKGIGKILLNAADEEAKGRGLKKVCLLVAHHNERAKKLYENWGYIAAKAYYGTKIFMFGDTGYYRMERTVV
ncbi:DgyrCDS14867 [Dimorphilus gyrociliatus]|uniref:DgyrCDS14867 n=1 Tax=Dimorphilus gyrociliatus TaxID=2664684 RepID=A0A7I8WF61_9ANNE|nr:DgyrCDS14867 [Dimorphilus gyrociliatus]